MDWKGPRSPKHIATIAVCDPIFHLLSLLLGRDPVWRQDLAILSPEGPRDNTCQLRPFAVLRWTSNLLSGRGFSKTVDRELTLHHISMYRYILFFLCNCNSRFNSQIRSSLATWRAQHCFARVSVHKSWDLKVRFEPFWLGKEKTNKHKHFGRDGVRDKHKPSLGQTGPLPGTNWDPSLGQTGLSLFNSTVKSPFCPVCPWDGWGFVPGTIVPQGRSEKCLCVFCLLVFFRPQLTVISGKNLEFGCDVKSLAFCDLEHLVPAFKVRLEGYGYNQPLLLSHRLTQNYDLRKIVMMWLG